MSKQIVAGGEWTGGLTVLQVREQAFRDAAVWTVLFGIPGLHTADSPMVREDAVRQWLLGFADEIARADTPVHPEPEEPSAPLR